MTTLVPMYCNTSSVLINHGYYPWIVIANQVSGGLPGFGSVGAVIGPSLVQQPSLARRSCTTRLYLHPLRCTWMLSIPRRSDGSLAPTKQSHERVTGSIPGWRQYTTDTMNDVVEITYVRRQCHKSTMFYIASRAQKYSWIADQRDAHEKSIWQGTRRVTINPRPPLESS